MDLRHALDSLGGTRHSSRVERRGGHTERGLAQLHRSRPQLAQIALLLLPAAEAWKALDLEER